MVKGFKPDVRACAHWSHTSGAVGTTPARVLHLFPAASPPTCSPAAGLEGRAPGYPALGKEILRPCPENLGGDGRKQLGSNRAQGPEAAQQKRVDTSVPPRSERARPGPAQSLRPRSATPPPHAFRSQPLNPATYPYNPANLQAAACSQHNGGELTSALRSQRRKERNPTSAVDPIGFDVLRQIREFTN